MEKVSFDNLPQAVSLLIEKVDLLQQLLQTQSNKVATDKPMSVNQAAKFVNLAVPTLYGLVSNRIIPFSKVGKRLYFSEQELTAWIQTGRSKTRAEISSNTDCFLTPKKSIKK